MTHLTCLMNWTQGYLLGNPFTDQLLDHNSKYKFAHQMGLLSNELYEVF